MKAYFDESGKHDAATVISMAGLLMAANTCKELQRRWHREAARKPRIPLPFHMSDCVCGSKLFGPWRNDEPARLDMQRRMIEAMRGLDMQFYGASIVRAAYKPVADDLRREPAYRDPWFFAFESAIQEMMFRSAATGKNHRVSFVLDRMDMGFTNRAVGLYEELLELRVSHSERFEGLTFEAKDQIAALQAIDIIVYEMNRHVTDCRLGGMPARWQAELVFERVSGNGLVWEKDRLQDLAELKQASP
jgi:hypothetical protein